MGRQLALGALLLLASCIEPQTSACGDRICPAGAVCVETLGQCFAEDQVAVCTGRGDGDACTGSGITEGHCRLGVCVDTSCGDGIVSGSEDCEEGDLRGARCEDAGFYEGQLACGADCRFDTGSCSGLCGDGELNGPEECDGSDLSGVECLDLGFDGGTIGCSAVCTTSFDACVRHGWRARNTGSARDIEEVWGTARDSLYIVGELGLFRYWDGLRWTDIDVASDVAWHGIDGTSSTDVWAVGSSGTVAHLDASGWSLVDVGTGVELNGVAAIAPDDVWVVGAARTVLHFDGSTWAPIDIGTPDPATLFTIEYRDSNIVIGGGSNEFDYVSDVYLSENGGESWNHILESASFYGGVRSVAIDELSYVYAAPQDYAGSLLFWDGGGWTNVGFTGTANFSGLHATASDDIMVMSDELPRQSYHWDGSSWVNLEYGLFATGTSTTRFGDVWIAAGDLGLLGELEGQAYAEPALEAPATVSDVAGTGRSDLYAAYDTKVSRFDGLSWTEQDLGTSVSSIASIAPGEVVATGYDGSVHQLSGGTSSPVTTPSISSPRFVRATGSDNIWIGGQTWQVMGFDGSDWTLTQLAPSETGVPYAMATFGPDDTWIGGGNAQLFHYDGTAWVEDEFFKISNGTRIIRAIGGTSSTDIYVGLTTGLYHNDGTGWSLVPELPNGLPSQYHWISAVGPSDVYVSVSAGGFRVYHYDGAMWTEISLRTDATLGLATPDALITTEESNTVEILVDIRK